MAFPALTIGEDEKTVEIDPISQLEITERIHKEGLQVVGWYHSHPVFCVSFFRFSDSFLQPDPSLRDIENQTNFQLLYRCNSSKMEPFIGAINGS